MAVQKRLFLLDAYALIFRGYYALIKNPRVNSKGQDTSAIMGFVNSLFDVIKREKPDHLAVAFDKGGSSERVEMYEDYKANRDETPEAIRIAVPIIQEILKAMHVPCIEIEGVEADDLIGTLAKQAEKEDYQVFMVTPDKDYAQLVSENIFMYKPARMGNGIEIWGIPEVQKRFEVERPEQVIDYLGMMGDASDNIPGLPGVGDKTAKKFIKQYGGLEGLLENTDQLKGKMKEKVIENAELGRLSRKLATIMTDCDVKFDAEQYELSQPDADKVQEIFDELEFRRLKDQFIKIFSGEADSDTGAAVSGTETAKKLVSSAEKAANAGAGQYNLFGGDEPAIEERNTRKTIKDTEHFYQSVAPGMAMNLFIKNLMKQTSVCFDTETTDLDPLQAELVGIAFSWEKTKGFYVPFPSEKEEVQKLIEALRPFFEAEEIEKIGQNLKYDIKVLAKYDVEVKGKLFDTMIAHYLINPDMRHNMDVLAETYLNYTPVSIEELIGKKGKNQKSMADVPVDQQTEYAVEDADVTLQLKEHFQKELGEANTQKLFDEIEIPLVQVLADMELEGINLDQEFLGSLSEALNNDIASLEKSIYEEAGEEFNIGSPKQLGEILFDKLKLVDKPKKTRTGQYSTAEDVLSYLAPDHEIVQHVLDYRGLSKLKSTYVDALPAQVNAKTGRVHTDYMQTVAATGRLSSNNPNLQNIPIRTERGRQVRKAFVPRNEDYVLLAADYSQIELRIIAALSQEETMMKAFQEGEDIHASTAAKVFNVPIDEVTREQRSNAKTVNFGIIYGVSAFGLSNQTDLTRSESKELIDTYYKTYPKLRNYMSEQVDFARENGYVSTVLGRRRYLKDINSSNAVVRGAAERNAVNAPIQGSAADIIKIAMIKIHHKLKDKGLRTKMLLQVHDELVFDVYKSELEEVQELIKSEMEHAFKLDVPLDVEVGLGDNWLDAH
ncbi:MULTISPECIES: DNA polymerase I [Leeuwenhoekiella]|jgi:DNA polymerase-1|uniref:DNA polymerase I n=1 Tax=Leeuwenhoekiella blandensis (strain CECT 7118 / CCUG 51940 / KCTC 22103 / MED217) TaxID=398720 RepID=A3XHP6_LEEBM|nr:MULTISPECIES: DNA polymerase I [Leeuwenhoekiella]EAQ51199.1 putative DNA polymerase I [Leeuwenhoekiella blandensis MED217]MAO42372.1 DNA polymerase I [Leeuwenhoekiella sp.]HBT08957.1 DNA polymerase I [Leeuwenhoekiella sp.]|tara:strand:+ start:32401 stop:35247 length:2847 start_codon:yes stop_codon:yes gene_type:complete